ncbi:kinase-like domain-containing protein [Zychaea mexicana]|uniref:kinase-like domain-containing protein n=1 Tax=Zychaea mexicana TaxID=64656 RepID=UPI0022FEC196|nr:kinase-like domain-containing protein [Zychaea mexicana]KAI9488831.1 kinase-like domain-containing protein [Zychaea mexicana]
MSAPDRPRVLLRVYGIGAEQLVDRQHELEWLARLSRMSTSLSPQLLAKFGNGRFEEYLESTTLTHADLHNPDISCQIAQCLRELHDVTEEYPPPTENCRVEVWRNISQWYAYARELLNQEEWKEKLKPLALDTALPKEIELCKAYMHRQDVPQSPVIFTHNDAQYGNVLRVEKTGELVLVDFEYAGYNPRGFDIANHFSEWMYDYHGPSPASYDVDKYPTEEEQLRFITAYIEAGDDANKDLLDPKELQQDALRWAMVVHLHWSLWGLVQASQSEIDYDYFLYFTERLKGFRKGLERALEQNTNSSSA